MVAKMSQDFITLTKRRHKVSSVTVAKRRHKISSQWRNDVKGSLQGGKMTSQDPITLAKLPHRISSRWRNVMSSVKINECLFTISPVNSDMSRL